MGGHKSAIQKAEVEVFALPEHVWKSNHRVDSGCVAILDHSARLYEWLALEVHHIRRQPLPLNRDRGILPAVYDGVMRAI